MILLVFALLLPSASYPFGSCELAAKDFQDENGAAIVIFYPVQRNGAFDFNQPGHVLNYKKIDGQNYYLDWQQQRIMLPWEYRDFILQRIYAGDFTEQQMDIFQTTWIQPDRPPFPWRVN